jgi:hypothetical protein
LKAWLTELPPLLMATMTTRFTVAPLSVAVPV